MLIPVDTPLWIAKWLKVDLEEAITKARKKSADESAG